MTTEDFEKAKANREEFNKAKKSHDKLMRLVGLAERAMHAKQEECYVSVQGLGVDGNIVTDGAFVSAESLYYFLMGEANIESRYMQELDEELATL